MKIVATIRYLVLGILRSNRFFGATIASTLILWLLYVTIVIPRIILPNDVLPQLLIAILAIDISIKYNFPGIFLELSFNFLSITQRPRLTAAYIILNVIFFHYNIVVFSTLALDIDVRFVLQVISIMIINHFIVIISKIVSFREILKIIPVFGINLFFIFSEIGTGLMLGLAVLTSMFSYTFFRKSLFLRNGI